MYNKLIYIRTTLEVIFIGFKRDTYALVPFNELERTSTYGRLISGVSSPISAFVNVFGDYLAGIPCKEAQQSRIRLREVQDNGVSIRAIDGFYCAPLYCHTPLVFKYGFDGEFYVFRGKRFTVMPLYIFIKMEGVGQTIVRYLPAFSKIGAYFIIVVQRY